MQTQRRSATAWGAAFGYSTIALSIARNIVLVPVYLHYVSAAEYGAWLATGGTLVQLLVSDFGVGGVILQRTAATAGAGDRQRLSVIVGTAWVTSIVLAIILSALSAGISPFIPRLLDLDPAVARTVIDCFVLAIVANAIGVLATISGSVLRGLQRSVSAGAIQLLAEVTVIVVTVAMLYLGFGLYALAWGMVARSVFAAVASLFQTWRVCVREMQLAPHFQSAEAWQLTADSARLFIVAVSMRFLTRSDVFFVGAVLGVQAAAVYGITTRIIDTINMIASQLNSALAPAMAHLYGEGRRERFRELLLRITPVLSAATLTGVALAAVVDESFVALWVGSELFGGFWLACAFAAASYLSAVGFIGYDALMAAGEFRFIARTFAVFAAVHVLLTVLLLNFGMLGAPVAAAVTAIGWGLVFWRRVAVIVGPGGVAWRGFISALAVPVAVVVVVVGLAYRLLPEASSWAALTLQVALVGAALVGGVGLLSAPVRRVALEEGVATARALGRRRG